MKDQLGIQALRTGGLGASSNILLGVPSWALN